MFIYSGSGSLWYEVAQNSFFFSISNSMGLFWAFGLIVCSLFGFWLCYDLFISLILFSEIFFIGATFLFITISKRFGNAGDFGLSFFILGAVAIESCIGLAIVLNQYRLVGHSLTDRASWLSN